MTRPLDLPRLRELLAEMRVARTRARGSLTNITAGARRLNLTDTAIVGSLMQSTTASGARTRSHGD